MREERKAIGVSETKFSMGGTAVDTQLSVSGIDLGPLRPAGEPGTGNRGARNRAREKEGGKGLTERRGRERKRKRAVPRVNGAARV